MIQFNVMITDDIHYILGIEKGDIVTIQITQKITKGDIVAVAYEDDISKLTFLMVDPDDLNVFLIVGKVAKILKAA